MNQAVQDFVERYQIDYNLIDLEREVPKLLEEMQAGLDGKPSSLLMLPTYLTPGREARQGARVLCVDAGGTNLRLAVAQIDEGGFCMGEMEKHIMPGVEHEVSAEEFFRKLAEYIFPYLQQTTEISISFAYRASAMPDLDCEIIEISKEVKVRDAGGKRLAHEIDAQLRRMGAPSCTFTVINDSVATALSGMAEHPGFGAFTGTILGTGANCCYLEAVGKIGKISGGDAAAGMVINTEMGSYDKMQRSVLDDEFTQQSQIPDKGKMEKMMSGAYLGGLCGLVLNRAVQEGVLQSKTDFAGLTTKQVNDFLHERCMDGLHAEDVEAAHAILLNLVRRAGRLLALQMAGCATKSIRQNQRICLTIEGTTYDKMFGLKEEALRCLHAYCAAHGLEDTVSQVDLAVMKGCAIAALSAER